MRSENDTVNYRFRLSLDLVCNAFELAAIERAHFEVAAIERGHFEVTTDLNLVTTLFKMETMVKQVPFACN